MKQAKTPLIITCLLIPVTVIVRVVSVVRYSDTAIDWFSLAVAGLLVLFTALLLLAAVGKKQETLRPKGNRAVAISVLCMISGGALVLRSLADTVAWINTGATPPPMNYSVRSADLLLLVLLLISGILGGLYLVYVGLTWLREKACVTMTPALPALFPALWGWFRLARYAVSYVSATGLGDTVYDYGHLIFSLLFLMMLAHFISGDKPVRQSNWIAVALPAAWFGIAGMVGAFVLAVLPEGTLQREIHAGNMAGWADLPLAVLALFMAADALLNKPTVQAEPVPDETVIPVEQPPVPVADTTVIEEELAAEAVISAPEEEIPPAASAVPEPVAVKDDATLVSEVLKHSEENRTLDDLLNEFSSKNEK